MATKEFGVNKLNINSSTVVEGILDEDDLSSDSATKLATQQSIKKYVDDKVTTDLDVSDGTTDISIDFGSEKLSILGTSGEINTVASGNDVTLSVPGLAAGKITSGNFDVARIPNLGAGKITSGTFDAGRIPTLNQDTTGSAAKVKVTDNENTDEENLIAFVADAAATTGPQSLEMDGDLKYNPSTGRLSSPAIRIGGESPSSSALSVKMATDKHIGFNPSQSEVGNVPALVAFKDNGSLQDMGFRGTTLRFAQASTERLHINSSGLLVNGSIKNIASIVNCSITSGGTDGGRTEGSYTVIDAGGSASGTGADFVVDVDANGTAELTKQSGGTGYAANETITIAKADIGGGTADLVITVSSITPVVQFHGNGSNLTNLNGTNIASGTIAAARVATLNQDTTGSAAKLTTARNIGGVSFDGSAAIDLPGVNASGDQDTTGNAATATKLAAAVNIGGVSFDGSAAIDLPGVNAASTQDTSGSAAKLTTARTIGGVSFDGTANINLPGVNAAGNQNTTGSAAKLTTARTIGGVSFDGSANINLPGVNAAGNQDTSGNAGGLTGNPNIGVTGIIAGGTAIIENDFIVKADNKMLKVQNASGTDKFTVDTDNGNTSIIGTGTPTIESPSGGNLNITAATTAASGNLSVGGNITVAGTGTPTIESPSGGNLNITAATATFSGNITASSGTITGNGSGLTTLNGSNISSGTVAAARVATLNQDTTGSSGSCTGNAATATNAVNVTGTIASDATGTTQSAGNNSTKIATTAYTDTAISNLVDSSPSALNTLNELAAALGDDANFSTTVTNSIATKQAALTFGIANTNAIKIDDADAADNDYAKLTASGIEGRSYAEVKTDLSLGDVENTALSTWAGTSNITTVGSLGALTVNGNTFLGASDSNWIDFNGKIASDFIPYTVVPRDLGNSSDQWHDLYIDGTAHIDTLDVDENATIDGTLNVTGTSTFTDINLSDPNPTITLYESDSSSGWENYGFIKVDSSTFTFISKNGQGYGDFDFVSRKQPSGGSDQDTSRFYISGDGNIGVGADSAADFPDSAWSSSWGPRVAIIDTRSGTTSSDPTGNSHKNLYACLGMDHTNGFISFGANMWKDNSTGNNNGGHNNNAGWSKADMENPGAAVVFRGVRTGNADQNERGEIEFWLGSQSSGSNWTRSKYVTIDSTGLELDTGNFTGNGSGLTNLPAGQLTGSLPAIDGSNLTGISGGSSDKISEGNTEVETIDTGSDGYIKFKTEGIERLRIKHDSTLLHVTTADAKGITQNSVGDFYIKNIANADRSSAGASILALHAQWDDKDVGAIKFRTGDDTTNKDDGHICFETSFSNNISEKMRIANNGKVGIGSDDPTQQLDVAGVLKVYGSDGPGKEAVINPNSSGGTGETLIGKSNGDLRIQAGSGSYQSVRANVLLKNSGGNVIINGQSDNAGKVGIGNLSPTEKLDVTGNIKASGTCTASHFYGDGSNLTNITTTTATKVNIQENNGGIKQVVFCSQNGTGSQDLYIDTNDSHLSYNPNLGRLYTPNYTGGSGGTSGTGLHHLSSTTISRDGMTVGADQSASAPAYLSSNYVRLDAQTGNFKASGIATATNFNSSSDIRLKTNIQPIDDPLAKVIQIEGVSFNWKKDNRPALGVIADQVEEILPELVHDDPKTVNYNGLIGLLIEAVKEQQTQIDSLKNRLSKLE